jgi:bifunctional DNase/RNase
MSVVGVAPTADGEAVLLLDEARSVIVPIFVGGTEALSIQLRARKQRYERPLTHDLLDAVMRELGGSLVKVQVDDLKGTTFVGAIFLRVGDRTVEIDARPSDAIALAIGNHVPIFVAKRVIEQAGVRNDPKPGDASRPNAGPRI